MLLSEESLYCIGVIPYISAQALAGLVKLGGSGCKHSVHWGEATSRWRSHQHQARINYFRGTQASDLNNWVQNQNIPWDRLLFRVARKLGLGEESNGFLSFQLKLADV